MNLYREQVNSLIFNRREVRDLEKTWREGKSYLKVLQELYPQGKIEGEAFRVSGSGDSGRRMSFIYETGAWVDFSDEGNVRNGLFRFVWEIEGWDGICRIARTIPLDFDFVVFNGAPVREDGIHRLAMKNSWMVARKWDYVDFDGFFLGKRIRYEMSNGEKQFRTLAYRTRKVTVDSAGRTVEHKEGWRLDGGWGPLAPLYIDPEDAKSNKPMLIVEGEKAKDAAKLLVGDEYAVATWGGGAAGSPKKAYWSPFENRQKIYWPDKDGPGKKSVLKLCDIDSKMRVVPTWDLKELNEKDDLADVDETRREWVLNLLQTAPYGIKPASEIVGNRYLYIIHTEEFVDVDTGIRLSPMALRRAHRHEVEQMDEELLADPVTQKLMSVTYWPGQGKIVEEIFQNTVVKKFNMWKDTGCESEEGEAKHFLAHMKKLIPDETTYNDILDYLAYQVQHPGIKIHWAPLIKGRQGIGKSYILAVMKKILGSTNVREITTAQLTSDFNPWAESSQLIVIEEIMAIGRREITNVLKPLITSPTVNINNKGVKVYEIPARMNFILFSNEEVPLLLDDDDRRFLVYESPLQPQGEAYYNTLFEALENGEAGEIRNYLEERDVSKFNPKGKAPWTESKSKMQSESENHIVSVMREYIESRRTPFERDVVELLDVVDWVSGQKGVRPSDMGPRSAAKFLTKLGAVPGGEIHEEDRVKKMFIVRNHENYLPKSA